MIPTWRRWKFASNFAYVLGLLFLRMKYWFKSRRCENLSLYFEKWGDDFMLKSKGYGRLWHV